MTQIRKIIRLNYDNFLDAPFFYYNEEFEIKNKRRQEGLPDQIYLFLFSYNLTLDYPLHLSEPNNDFWHTIFFAFITAFFETKQNCFNLHVYLSTHET